MHVHNMKVQSTIYKGIEYVQVSTLPADQREKLLKTINQGLLIKILVDGKLVSNCLQFKDYEEWFENIFKDQTRPVKSKTKQKGNGSATPIRTFKKS
jgi:hypothetical protein